MMTLRKVWEIRNVQVLRCSWWLFTLWMVGAVAGAGSSARAGARVCASSSSSSSSSSSTNLTASASTSIIGSTTASYSTNLGLALLNFGLLFKYLFSLADAMTVFGRMPQVTSLPSFPIYPGTLSTFVTLEWIPRWARFPDMGIGVLRRISISMQNYKF